MKIGLGLYRHMLTRDYYDFARQAGCTHAVVHLVDYFNQGPSNPRNNQPTGSKYEAWGVAGDPTQLWTVRLRNLHGLEHPFSTSILARMRAEYNRFPQRRNRAWESSSGARNPFPGSQAGPAQVNRDVFE